MWFHCLIKVSSEDELAGVFFEPRSHVDIQIDSAAGSLVGFPFSILYSNVHFLVARDEHGADDVVSVILALGTFVEVFTSLVCNVCCNVQSFQVPNLPRRIGIEAILDDEVPKHGRVFFGQFLHEPKLVDRRVVAVVCPKNSVFHSVACPVRLVGLRIYEGSVVFSRVQVLEKGTVASHCLRNEDRGIARGHIGCTGHHVIHSEGVLSSQPYFLGFFEIVGLHEDIPQPEGSLEAEFCFFHGSQSCFMDSDSGLGHACECSEISWESDSCMGNSIANVPNKDDFIFVDSCISCPVQVSHGVQFPSFSSCPPRSHEGTMDDPFVDKLFNKFDQGKKVVLNEVQQVGVLNSESLFHEDIQHGIHDVSGDVSGVGRHYQDPLEHVPEFGSFVELEACVLDACEFLQECVRDSFDYKIVVLPVQEHFQDAELQLITQFTGKEGLVSPHDLLAHQCSIGISGVIVRSSQVQKFHGFIILNFRAIDLVQSRFS